MADAKTTKRLRFAANSAGLVLLLFIVILRVCGLVCNFVLIRIYPGGLTPAHGVSALPVAPEWLLGLCSLVIIVIAFVPPILLALKFGRKTGLKLQFKKGPLPFFVLLPLFLGVMIFAGSLSSLIQSAASAAAGQPVSSAGTLPEGTPARIIYFLATCIFAPVLEEILFRGGVQGLLRRFGPRISILATTIIFTLCHAVLWDLPSVFILSLTLCYIAQINRSIGACILLHFANNTFNFILLILRESLAGSATLALILWIMFVFLAFFAAAIWYLKSQKLGKYMRLPKEPKERGYHKSLVKLLTGAPFFSAGILAVLIHFILQIFGI